MKNFLLWLPMIPIAILNGMLREFGYKEYVGELAAHQISTVIGIVLIGLYIFLIFRFLKITSKTNAFQIGITWLAFTVLFEFGFGYFVMGHPFSKLISDYNIFEGRVWALFLIWLVLAPYLIYKRKLQRNNSITLENE